MKVERAALVDGEGVPHVLDDRVVSRVRQVLRAQVADRFDRVPDAEKADVARPRVLTTERIDLRAVVCSCGAESRVVALAEAQDPIRLRDGRPMQYTAAKDDAGERSYGERAAAETEEKDLVAGLVNIDQRAVELPDVLGRTEPEAELQRPAQPPQRRPARVWIREAHLRQFDTQAFRIDVGTDSRVVDRELATFRGVVQHAAQAQHVGIVASDRLPGAVR